MGILPQTRQKGDVDVLFSKGSGMCVREVCVRFLFRSPRSDRSSFSFICGKKTLHSAVLRNRMRRRMRESIRKKKERIVSGSDIAIIFRGKKELSYQELDMNIEEVFKKAHLFIA